MCYFSTEINSVHTRNLNGILEITKKKKKTTTSILQGISTDNNVLARTSKVKETQRKLKAHEARSFRTAKGTVKIQPAQAEETLVSCTVTRWFLSRGSLFRTIPELRKQLMNTKQIT